MNIKTMLKTMGIGAVIFLILSAFPLFAQEEFENEPPFIRELAVSLAARGWTAEDLDALVTAARSMDWSGVAPDAAEVTAFALHLGIGRDGIDLDDPEEGEGDGTGLIQAQAALEIALASMELDGLGYEERVVARAALNGVRNMLSTIHDWKQEGRQENLGLLIRNQIREQVVAEVKQQEQVMGKRNGDARGRAPGGGITGGGVIPPNSTDGGRP